MTTEEYKTLLADVDSRYIRQIQEQVPYVAAPGDWRVILSFYLDNRSNQPHGIDKVAMLIVDCLDKLRDDTIRRRQKQLKGGTFDASSTKEILDELIRRLNYDGSDIDSLTVGEIRRAV